MLVLKKDPKFSLMQQPNKETFSVENEISLAKQDQIYMRKNMKKGS